MAQANYVTIVFCQTITGVSRNASTKSFGSTGRRDLNALVTPPPRPDSPPARNMAVSSSGSCRHAARRAT
jgi:hypothetical protein